MIKKIQGIIAPVTTPFEKGMVSVGHLRENLVRYAETGLSGLFLLGSNGENRSLTREEKVAVLRAALAAKAKSQFLMVGTGCESTYETILLSQEAAGIGADYVCLLSPSYYKKHLDEDAIARYFTDVAEAVQVPILLYNAPGYTGTAIPPRVVEYVSKHPNIVGMKDSSADGYIHYLPVCGKEFAFLSGTVNSLFAAVSLGACGGVISLADAFPQACCTLLDKLSIGMLDEARDLYLELCRLGQSISGRYGVAGVKYAMDVAGYRGGDPRLPLLPLKNEDRETIKKAIEIAGVL